jgi:hypothetical protein
MGIKPKAFRADHVLPPSLLRSEAKASQHQQAARPAGYLAFPSNKMFFFYENPATVIMIEVSS